jgi:molybdopterin/thiamine biosynthesis adenylyltransferase/molybdopterin synthase catalytic subunit/rhodanese-related sulfurtransferase
MFQLSSQSFNPVDYLTEFRDSSCGAFTSFEGWVRDHHHGQKVIALEYEALASLCESEAQKILHEAKNQFGVTKAMCLHRVGRVAVGEMSVWIGVSAAHRDEAFKACRYIIDELKQRLPIWKKEIYADGSADWVNCQEKQKALLKEKQYYLRQNILSEVGDQGQKTLKAARVLVVGAGGLGSSALTSLVQAGVGTIGIVEFDALSASNLHRQSLYSIDDLGKKKIDLAALRLRLINPFVRIESFPFRLDAINYAQIIPDYEIILDCTDNFTTKFLLNDIAVLSKKTLIQASIYQFEGQLRVYSSSFSGACLRCLWPTIPSVDCVGNCAQAGVMGVVPNVMGHLQAWETIKLILRLPQCLNEDMLTVDFKTFGLNKIKQSPLVSCPLCGEKPSIKNILAENYMTAPKKYDLSLNLDEISIDQIDQFVFIDVRETIELMMAPVKNIKSLHLPFSQFGSWKFEFEPEKRYLLYCAHGMRSSACVEKLRNKGVSNVQSINDGAQAINQYFATFSKGQS